MENVKTNTLEEIIKEMNDFYIEDGAEERLENMLTGFMISELADDKRSRDEIMCLYRDLKSLLRYVESKREIIKVA